MYKQDFTIQNYPNDIYYAVGQIIKSAQEWEQKYKKLAFMLNISIKKISSSSLNKLNEALKKNNLISEKEYNDLKHVIRIRNYINHEFYLQDFHNSYNDYDEYIKNIERILNESQFLIFEATDIVDNKIDKLEGCGIARPTAFD